MDFGIGGNRRCSQGSEVSVIERKRERCWWKSCVLLNCCGRQFKKNLYLTPSPAAGTSRNPPEVDLDIQLEKNLRAQLKVPGHEMGLVRALVERRLNSDETIMIGASGSAGILFQ